MTDPATITDADLARARQDPQFRQQLLASNLDRLLVALARLRSTASAHDPVPARQIREGVQLAVKLANILQQGGGKPGAHMM